MSSRTNPFLRAANSAQPAADIPADELTAPQVLQSASYHLSASVQATAEHSDGFTVYKVELKAVPKDPLDKEPLYFAVWSRYRDLHALWLRLRQVHQQLHLRGDFPPYPKPKLLGKRDAAVIDERRVATALFINLALTTRLLCKSSVLQDFFQMASKSLPPAAVAETEAPMQPTQWAEDVTLLDVPRPSSNESASDGLSQFDPCSSRSPPVDASLRDNRWLLENMDPLHYAETADDSSKSTAQIFIGGGEAEESESSSRSHTPQFVVQDCVLPSTTPSSPRRQQDSQQKSADASNISRFFPHLKLAHVNGSVRKEKGMKQVRSESSFAELLAKSTGWASPGRRRRRAASPPPPQTTTTTGRPTVDYVVQAAHFISAAHKAEDEQAFELAFSCYKSAVNLLLQGVQGETDAGRRNAVRKKTAKYLTRAERLYRAHVAFDAFEPARWTAAAADQPLLLTVRAPAADLCRLRFVRRLGHRALLVDDAGSLRVLKLLDKSSHAPSLSAQHRVPLQVPHMAHLVKFFETPNAIILLIEYTDGAPLWHFLRHYFGTLADDAELKETSVECTSRPVYGGKRDRFSVSDARRRSSHFDSLLEEDADSESVLSPESGGGAAAFSDVFDRLNASLSEFTIDEDSRLEEERHADCSADSANVTADDEADAMARVAQLVRGDAPWPRAECLPRRLIARWLNQLAAAIVGLHAEGVVVGDLTPSDLLLDSSGSLVLTYQSRWVGVDTHLSFYNQYAAPELRCHTDVSLLTEAADWWTFGAIMFELFASPLAERYPYGCPQDARPLWPNGAKMCNDVKQLVNG